ncbi:MAG: sugar kinase [Pseudomonadota bacterium]
MTPPRVLCVGEAMVELAPLPDGTYKRGFAGDTFNTAWHMAQLLGASARVGFVTRVGRDSLSEAFCAELAQDGLETSVVSEDPARSMGLYMIALDGAERSFHYWRSSSAARGLADAPDVLARALNGADLIHLSGITVAILPPKARITLLDALKTAQSAGSQISFDPNVRPALWSTAQEPRETLPAFLDLADILLPGVEDAQALWGACSAGDILARLERAGRAVVVKDGGGSVAISVAGDRQTLPTPPAPNVVDTTGAGDAFNAGYLCAHLAGHPPATCVAEGQRIARLVLAHPGARAEKADLRP